MSHESRKKRKTQKSRGIEVDMDAARILRTVSDGEAFYFYEDFGKPIGEKAKSLHEFLEKVKHVKLESILFHLQRKDFQKWIETVFGDSKLAKKIGRIRPTRKEDLRTEIQSVIENRLRELRETPLTLSVSEDLTVTSPSSTS
ncbi:MAG: DUF5752 family protein [Candidatus Bathyarchaeia archaeon]